jgi:hypothetical protein
MQLITLRLDDRVYTVDPAQDLAALRARLVDAVRLEADFVEFRTITSERVAALVSERTVVVVEVVSIAEQSLAGDVEDAPPLDLDEYA